MATPLPRLYMHSGGVVPHAPFVARFEHFGGTPWYRRADYLSILLVASGEGTFGHKTASGARRFQKLEPGSMALLRPWDVTTFEGSGDDGMSIAYVSFPIASWRAFAALTSLDPNWARSESPPQARIALDDPDGIPAFRRALERSKTGPTIFDLVRFWGEILPNLLGPVSLPESAPISGPAWLAAAVSAMHEEANLRGGVARLLELARISSRQLATITRRNYGCTPTELVAELRLRRAAELLRTTDETVNGIASRCGYSSLVYFSGRFRNAYGVSPRDYRHRLINPPSHPRFSNVPRSIRSGDL